LSVTIVIGQHVGWERIFRQQMENSPRTAQMTAEQRDQALAIQMKLAPFISAIPVIVLPVSYLIVSAILLGIVAGIMSAPVKFKQVFAVMCYAGLTAVVSAILTLVVIFLKNPDQFNPQNPLAFNPAAFMDPTTTSKFLYSLGTSIDLFSFWTIFLIATGLKAAAGKKLSFGGALFSVILPWAVCTGQVGAGGRFQLMSPVSDLIELLEPAYERLGMLRMRIKDLSDERQSGRLAGRVLPSQPSVQVRFRNMVSPAFCTCGNSSRHGVAGLFPKGLFVVWYQMAKESLEGTFAGVIRHEP